MKTQVIGKKLLLPLIVVEIAATVIGLSSPAQSTSLMGSQDKVIPVNPETTLIARPPRNPCEKPSALCWHPQKFQQRTFEQSPSENSSREQLENDVNSTSDRRLQQQPTAKPLLPTADLSPKVEPLPTAEPSALN